MKWLALLVSFVFPAFAQTPVRDDKVEIEADSQVIDGAIRHLSGHVVIKTNKMLLTADRADFNEDTGEITARGHARVKVHKERHTDPHSEQRQN